LLYQYLTWFRIGSLKL